jgi:autotransporter-associated beta strand protein
MMTTSGRHASFFKRPCIRLILAGVSVFCASAALAGDGTMLWINSTGNWGDSGSWRKNVIAQSGGVAALQGMGVLNQNVSGLTLRGIHFSAGIGNFYGYPITLTNSPFLDAAVSGTRLNLPLKGEGVLHKYGVGQIELTNSTFTGFSAVSIDEGTILVSSNRTEMVTGSSLLLNGGALVFAPTLAGGQAGLAYGATNAAAFFAYGAGTSWIQPKKGNGDSATVVLGGDGDGFVRTNRGALVLAPASGTNALGVTEKLFVKGNAPPVVNGMAVPSVVAADLSGSSAPYYFLTYDAANGFVTAATTDGLNGGSASIANVTNDTTLSDDAHVQALSLNNRKTLTIAAGKTMTVGNGTQPAGIILNAQGSTAAGATITGGTIDFGTSEGIVWTAGSSSDTQAKTISSTLTGQNGVTFASRNGTAFSSLNISGTNLYAGDTRIMGGRVSMLSQQAFGTGDIYVCGSHDNSGQLQVGSAYSLTNHLHLAGFGQGGSNGSAALQYTGSGTLALDNTLTLMADVGILITSTGTIRANKPVEGEGSLYCSATTATGTLTLNATNTYAGKTIVQSGVLSLGAAATFGQGDVTNNSVVTFNTASTQLVTNNIGGSGSFVQNGTGTLIFAGNSVSLGTFDLGMSSVSVSGSNTCFQVLQGFGEIAAAAGPLNPKPIEIGSCTTNSTFCGELTDGEAVLGLTKVGTATLTLTRPQSYSGPTIIREGTLRLQAGFNRPLETGLSYWLDATDSSKVLTDANQTVTNWTDSSAAAVRFKKTAERFLPTYVQSAINGKPAVYFAGNTNRIASTVPLSQKSLFIVNMPTGYNSLAGIWGNDGSDFGIRMDSSTSWQSALNLIYALFNDQTTFVIDGQANNQFAQNKPHILYGQRSAGYTCNVALGNYIYTQTTPRSYNGYIGEVIAYNRVVSQAEREQIEDYLADKWLGCRLHSDAPQSENILPSGTALSLENRAVLDLGGVSQTVASLSGEGTITNSSGTVATLTVTGPMSFSGVIAGNIKLVKPGSSATDLSVKLATTNDVVLAGGTVRLTPYSVKPIQTGLAYWLDASATNTLRVDANNLVTNWISSSGNGVMFMQPPSRTYDEPAYVTNAINGKSAIRFDGTNWMYTPVSCKVQTLFIVTATTGYQQYSGLWAPTLGIDSGLRLVSATSWRDGIIGEVFYDGVYRVNGVATKAFTVNTPYVFCGQTSLPKTSAQNVLGQYHPTANRGYIGDIGEVLAYDYALSEEEVRYVEAYLTAKWLTNGGLDTSDVIFSQTGRLILTNSVVVDLGGTRQTIHNLSGSGSFQNGSLTLDGTLTVQVTSDGTCDQINVDGSLALSQTILNVQGLAYLDKTQPHTILTATGNIAGTFAAANLTKAWTVKVTETSATLVPYGGTAILLK